jgi:hypothetical protein
MATAGLGEARRLGWGSVIPGEFLCGVFRRCDLGFTAARSTRSTSGI